MVDTQPDLVMMAIITSDFDLARTPMIHESGYLIDERMTQARSPESIVRQIQPMVHLTYALRDMKLRWFFPSSNIGQMFSRGEIPEAYEYVRRFKSAQENAGSHPLIVLLQRTRQNAWRRIPNQLSRDVVTHIDLSILRHEFMEEQYRANRFDPHPSAAVHHRIGEFLADYVQHQPGFAQ